MCNIRMGVLYQTHLIQYPVSEGGKKRNKQQSYDHLPNINLSSFLWLSDSRILATGSSLVFY